MASLFAAIVQQIVAYNKLVRLAFVDDLSADSVSDSSNQVTDLSKHLKFFQPLENLRYSAARYTEYVRRFISPSLLVLTRARWLQLQAQFPQFALPRYALVTAI